MDEAEFGRELRTLAAVKLYELGHLYSGRAAQLANMSRVEFLLILGRYKVFPLCRGAGDRCPSLWYHFAVLLLADAPLTLREFVTHEEAPLASIFREVLDFLAGRSDVIIFGAHAVNAYCEPERMTQDVDLLSTRASELAEQLRAHLAERLHIAARVREVIPGQGFRVYEVRKPSNRHLVDVRHVDALPSSQPFGEVRVIAPPELVAMKVIRMVRRAGRPKAGTDLVDVQRLLLTFPDLKVEEGAVIDKLRDLSAPGDVIARWREIAQAPLKPDEDEGY
jgi:Uncharacterised protein family (UPF0175)/Nucleotidyl transferase AbiEii toxin, Type IV TA system